LTDVDVFAPVLMQFRRELTPAATAALTQAAPLLELDTLLPAMRDFILGQLTREGTSADGPLKVTLEYAQFEGEFLCDFEWFDDHFPSEGDLVIGTSLACFRLLEKCQKI
jgi:hypothetical protein